MGKLEGKVALVTGASRGIGRDIALTLAREGAKVGVNCVSNLSKAEAVVAEIKNKGGDAIALHADVTNPAQVKEMVDRLLEEYGKIDILVNNAGILVQGKLVDTSLDIIKQMIDVDLFGVFIVTKEVLPHMIKANTGRIVNIASQLGQKGGVELTAYSAAKGGVIALTKALALELGALGMKTDILVNCVAPGPIESDMTDTVSKEWRAAKEATLPLGRYGVPEEVSPAVLFLCCDDSAIFIGQVLCPNSGDTMVG